jgi:hypothetical protein
MAASPPARAQDIFLEIFRINLDRWLSPIGEAETSPVV